MAPLDVLMHVRRARAASDLAQAMLAQRVLAGKAKSIAFRAARSSSDPSTTPKTSPRWR